MKTNELEVFRYQLRNLEQHIGRDVNNLADEAFYKRNGKAIGNQSNVPVEDLAELGSDNGREEVTIGLFERASTRLREINSALGRIDGGNFGCCEKCGQEISRTRLQAVPFARQCVKCSRNAQPR